MSESAVVEEEGAVLCAFGDGNKGTKTVQVEGQSILVVCTPCERLLHAKNKLKRCQYCGVPIAKGWKKEALVGFYHTRGCPRSQS